MGGNAIKRAKRISREKYFSYLDELKFIFKDLQLEPVKAYHQIEDFGDIDIVVKKIDNLNIKSLVKERLNIEEYYDNGPFFSFLYKDAQVDFIFMNKDEYNTALNYFHWNDLGNFIGRTARSINFKYGHDGLSYEEHLDDHYKISVHVASDMKGILSFLGYDYDTWVNGFNTIDEILSYAASSTIFNSLYFDLEEQAHNDRVRNKKRKMYQNMIKYINDNNILPKPKLSQEERLNFYKRAVDYFGCSFDLKVKEEKEKYEEYKKFKKLFNGDIVKDLTGLEGKALGNFIQQIHRNVPNLRQLVLEHGEKFVENIIKSNQ